MSDNQKTAGNIDTFERTDGKLAEAKRPSVGAQNVEPLPAHRRATLEADIARFLAEFDGGES